MSGCSTVVQRSGTIVTTATSAAPRHHEYWNGFYAGTDRGLVPEQPSAFAEWVDRQLPPAQEVVELGFGTARDTLFFARRGRAVHGFDFAESAVAGARTRAAAEALSARFSLLDLYDDQGVDQVAASFATAAGTRAVYGRFLVHSLEDAGRANLLRLAATVLRSGGGELFLEFRTGKDLGQEHLFGDDHFRQFVDPMVVVLEVEELGGEVTHLEEGCGLAVYKTEDPHVARLIARFP